MNLAFFNDPNNKLSCALSVMGNTVFEGRFQISEGSGWSDRHFLYQRE